MQENTNKIESLFDQWAGKERGESMAKGHDELVNNILNDWTFASDDKILDLGCGNGRALSEAKSRGAEYLYGLDLSSNMIEQAKKNIPNGEFYIGTIENLPWADNSFTHIMSIEALYYVDNLEKAFSEIARVLKPEGKISIAIDYYKENEGSLVWKDCLPFDIHCLSSTEWIDLMTKSGITGISSSRIKRKEFKSENDFKASKFFPSYELYKLYQDAGALKLSK